MRCGLSTPTRSSIRTPSSSPEGCSSTATARRSANDERAKLAFYIGGLGTGGMHAGALAGIVHEPVAAWTAGGMALGCAWAVRAWRKTAPHPHPY